MSDSLGHLPWNRESVSKLCSLLRALLEQRVLVGSCINWLLEGRLGVHLRGAALTVEPERQRIVVGSFLDAVEEAP